MTQEIGEAAAAVIVEGARVVRNLEVLHGRLRLCFARTKPFEQARKYMTGLMSDLPRKNGWQYMGCAGRVANGVNTVYCSYATPGGHALVGARIYVPAEQLADPEHRAALGIPAEVEFKTKSQLAQEILADMIVDESIPPWIAGDEVYGRAGKLRTFIQDNGIGYVMRVGCAFTIETRPGQRIRTDTAMATHLSGRKHRRRWQVCSVTGSKGERAYAWAWIATTSPHHYLLIRKHLSTGELAYHYCHIPAGQPNTLMTLVRVACLRWPVEEGFEFGKDHFGLDHSQVRLYTALLRHIVLTLAALAVCAITAAQAKTRAPAPILGHGHFHTLIPTPSFA